MFKILRKIIDNLGKPCNSNKKTQNFKMLLK